jgi:bacterioferritin
VDNHRRVAAEGKGEGRAVDKVLAVLAALLHEELAAIHQYIQHAAVCDHQGYGRAAASIMQRAQQEMKHADALMDRALFLGATPDTGGAFSIEVPGGPLEAFTQDGALEATAIDHYRQGVAVARAAGDDQTADLLGENLEQEEEHALYIQQQLALAEAMGLQNWLTTQV